MANRLKEKYLNEVVPSLTEQFNYSSVMASQKVDKNMFWTWVLVMQYQMLKPWKAAEELAFDLRSKTIDH